MKFTKVFNSILMTCGFAVLFRCVYAELVAYPDTEPLPNGVIDANGNINFSDLSLQLMNDFVLMAQVFVTCVPSMILAPAVPFFAKVSCSFNLLSVLSLLSLSILDGWDRLNENGPFKVQMKELFEVWAQNETADDSHKEMEHELGLIPNPVREICRGLDLHLDLFMKPATPKDQMLICSCMDIRNSTFFEHKPLTQELCVSKKGIQRFTATRLSKMPISTTQKLVKFLLQGGIFKTVINPPLYLYKIIESYGEFADEITQKMYDMTTIIHSESWDGHEIGMSLQENNTVLFTINYRRGLDLV